jgi:hypothetical protein
MHTHTHTHKHKHIHAHTAARIYLFSHECICTRTLSCKRVTHVCEKSRAGTAFKRRIHELFLLVQKWVLNLVQTNKKQDWGGYSFFSKNKKRTSEPPEPLGFFWRANCIVHMHIRVCATETTNTEKTEKINWHVFATMRHPPPMILVSSGME